MTQTFPSPPGARAGDDRTTGADGPTTGPPGTPPPPPGRLVVMLAIQVLAACVVLVGFVGLFAGLQRAPVPHALPIAVVQGPLSAAAAQGWGDEAEVVGVADAAAARAAVRDHSVVAAVAPGADGSSMDVYLAGANGAAETGAATALTTGLAGATHLTPSVTDLVPLTGYDPRGLAGFYTVFGATLASFIFGQILLASAGALPMRGKVATIAAFALVAGTLAALLGGPILGTLPASLPALVLTLALLSAAVTTTTLALATVLGPAGLLVATLLLTVTGNALSGATLGAHLMPPALAAIGAALPPGAAIRTVADLGYFDGAGVATPLLTLAVWTAGALIITAAASRRRAAPALTTSTSVADHTPGERP